jgi:peptidoglycan/LPS O-acetylase OafA/YrhL
MKYEPQAIVAATAATTAAATPAATAPAHGYRPDIDGMRALAVLSVILFHISKELLPGGFVGVDIFFVISGYLISAHIFQSHRQGTFSFIDFYYRRIRRIAPAMTVVVAVTLAVAEWVLLPDDARAAAKSAVMSFASLANVHFWLNQDTGYFAASSNELPLLHLWSLGVEEQFYMVWPPLAILICRWRSGRALAVMGVLALASFAIGQFAYAGSPTFAYYLLPSRGGELLVGAIAANIALSGRLAGLGRHALALAGIGLALVLATMVLLSERVVFPGWWALPPTVGAALLILGGGAGANPVSRLLAVAPLRAIGAISYSAYLWHWPLLAFYRYGYGEPGFGAGIAVFALTMFLATLTYRYVEQPVRLSRRITWRTAYAAWFASSAVLIAVAAACVYADRIAPAIKDSKYAGELAALRALQLPTEYDYVCQRARLDPSELNNQHCVIGKAGPPASRVLLMGDSNAAHYTGAVGVFAEQGGFRFRNFEVGSCPPLFGNIDSFVTPARRAACRASQAVWKAALDQAGVVILGGTWSEYQKRSPTFLPTFLEQVRHHAAQGKTVVLLGKVPVITDYDRLCREKALRFPFRQCDSPPNPVPRDVAEVNETLRRFAESTPHVRYFDVTAALCPDGRCSAYGPNHEQLYVDKHHLSMIGSWFAGRRVYEANGMPAAFRFE